MQLARLTKSNLSQLLCYVLVVSVLCSMCRSNVLLTFYLFLLISTYFYLPWQDRGWDIGVLCPFRETCPTYLLRGNGDPCKDLVPSQQITGSRYRARFAQRVRTDTAQSYQHFIQVFVFVLFASVGLPMHAGSSRDRLPSPPPSGRMASRKIRALHEIDNNPASKRARMLKVINTKDTSSSALAEIVEGLTGAKPNQDELHILGQARFETLVEKIELPKKGGAGNVDWELCNPNLLLSRVVPESPTLQAWLSQALEDHPCSESRPWRLLIG